jgi:hypothetical protein
MWRITADKEGNERVFRRSYAAMILERIGRRNGGAVEGSTTIDEE